MKSMRTLCAAIAVVGLAIALTTCNIFSPSSKNTQKTPVEEEWPDDLPPEEVRLDENGQPMHRIPIVLRKSDELIARLTAAQEQARGLDIEVAQLCINWFEVVVRDSEAAGNYYFASGTSHPDLPKENTILYLWLPYTFSTNAGYWLGNVMCYGGYRRRADNGVGYDQTLLAIGECTHIDNNTVGFSGGNVYGTTESLTFLMRPLEFDVKAREHPNFFDAIGVSPRYGTNLPDRGGPPPYTDGIYTYPPSAKIGTPPSQDNPAYAPWLAWLAGYRGYNIGATTAGQVTTTTLNMSLLPAGSFWIQNPGLYGADGAPGYFSTPYQGNYHTWVSRRLNPDEPGDGGRLVIPYFEVPAHNSAADVGQQIRNPLSDSNPSPGVNQGSGDPNSRPAMAVVGRMWINGILTSGIDEFGNTALRPGTTDPITNSLQRFLDFENLSPENTYTAGGATHPRLLSTDETKVKGYVLYDRGAGGGNWNYQNNGLGYFVGLTTGDRGWALVSCNLPVRPVPYDEVNLNNPNNQHEVWYIRNGMYLTTPDYGIADGSLGGGILLRVVDEPNESFVGYPPLPDFIPTRYLPDPDYPGNPPIPTTR